MAKVITGVVRLSYLWANEPKTNDRGDLKYGAMLIIPKSDTKTVKAIKDAIQEAYAEGKALLGLKQDKLPDHVKQPLHDGDKERGEDAACKNAYYLNASSNSKPDIVDGKLQTITDPDEIYSGMYARVSLIIKVYNNEGKGITAYLNNIQKVKDGARLDGKTSGTDDFEEWESDGSDQDNDDDLN